MPAGPDSRAPIRLRSRGRCQNGKPAEARREESARAHCPPSQLAWSLRRNRTSRSWTNEKAQQPGELRVARHSTEQIAHYMRRHALEPAMAVLLSGGEKSCLAKLLA